MAFTSRWVVTPKFQKLLECKQLICGWDWIIYCKCQDYSLASHLIPLWLHTSIFWCRRSDINEELLKESSLERGTTKKQIQEWKVQNKNEWTGLLFKTYCVPFSNLKKSNDKGVGSWPNYPLESISFTHIREQCFLSPHIGDMLQRGLQGELHW